MEDRASAVYRHHQLMLNKLSESAKREKELKATLKREVANSEYEMKLKLQVF